MARCYLNWGWLLSFFFSLFPSGDSWAATKIKREKESRKYLKLKRESDSVISDSLWPHGLHSPWNSLGQNTWLCGLSLLQGIFPTQESNWEREAVNAKFLRSRLIPANYSHQIIVREDIFLYPSRFFWLIWELNWH